MVYVLVKTPEEVLIKNSGNNGTAVWMRVGADEDVLFTDRKKDIYYSSFPISEIIRKCRLMETDDENKKELSRTTGIPLEDIVEISEVEKDKWNEIMASQAITL